MFKGMYLDWMSDELATELGFTTEAEKQAYLAQQREAGEEAGKRWLENKMRICHGKDSSQIPRGGDYCYENYLPEPWLTQYETLLKTHHELDEEPFLLAMLHSKMKHCPYFEPTDHGTVICQFLEEEAIGYRAEDYEKACQYFGSPEAAEQHCTGSILLSDAVECCGRVLAALEAEAQGGGSE